jgi:endonuclease/exonuclease/phosphatase family metal-dependent hydrolase
MNRRLRVMTYNIWHGKNDSGLKRAAEVIRAAQPDIVGLQECWRDARPDHDKHLQLLQLLGWNDAFLAMEYAENLERGTVLRGPAIAAGQRAYGIAIFTPHEITNTAGKIMTFNPSADELYKERRGILRTD